MSYIEENLMNAENILYRGKLHWVVFLWPVIWFIVAIMFFAGGVDTAAVGSMFVLIAIIVGIASFINYTTSEFGITNKRVIVKVGFIRRNSIEVLLNKVEGIQVNQGILGRILGFGSITVSGTGGTKDPFHNISAPLEFRRKTQEQIASVQDSK
ncbi:MAG: PH domain-containing protein [Desulfosarcina sp.]|nr:PH domain-containing protein [Desulfobacterales bacterium]